MDFTLVLLSFLVHSIFLTTPIETINTRLFIQCKNLSCRLSFRKCELPFLKFGVDVSVRGSSPISSKLVIPPYLGIPFLNTTLSAALHSIEFHSSSYERCTTSHSQSETFISLLHILDLNLLKAVVHHCLLVLS